VLPDDHYRCPKCMPNPAGAETTASEE